MGNIKAEVRRATLGPDKLQLFWFTLSNQCNTAAIAEKTGGDCFFRLSRLVQGIIITSVFNGILLRFPKQ